MRNSRVPRSSRGAPGELSGELSGTEEYFNSGWCRFDRGAVSGFVEFQPRPVAVYSFHLNDAFQFQRSIRVSAETVGDARGQLIINYLHPTWSTVAFWYHGS